MNTYDIEHALLSHTYTDHYTWDYAGYKPWGSDVVIGAHKKGDPYTVEMNGWSEWDDVPEEGISVEGVGLVTHVDSVGGEGEGDYRHIVLKIEPEDGPEFFVKKTGYYSSYDGTDWDGELTVVSPREKTVTVYE